MTIVLSQPDQSIFIKTVDLANQNAFNHDLIGRIISCLFLLPGVWLIYYLLIIKPDASLADFQYYRNNFYSFFAAIAIVFGFFIMLRKGSLVFAKDASSKDNSQKLITYIVPGIIQGIILITFSYAIAGLVRDLFNYL